MRQRKKQWRWWASVLCLLLWQTSALQAMPIYCQWPQWENFKQTFLSEGGRVVERDSPRQQTTSEGQAYALLFALIANDRITFARILEWTQNNLAQGDLSAHLPAWLWGQRGDASWGVLDANSAADADTWFAYSLLEAGRLWHIPRYQALGNLLAQRIVLEESDVLPGLGRVLLPGKAGFKNADGESLEVKSSDGKIADIKSAAVKNTESDRADSSGSGSQIVQQTWRLNPSYLPVQVLRRLAASVTSRSLRAQWREILQSALVILKASAVHGFAPDWVLYRAIGLEQGLDRGLDRGLERGVFAVDPKTQGIGSYAAIRVYLWAGMLSKNDPAFLELQTRFDPMLQWTMQQNYPPEKIDTAQGRVWIPESAGVHNSASGAAQNNDSGCAGSNTSRSISSSASGPAGFSAALLPALEQAASVQHKASEALELQEQRIIALEKEIQRGAHYYDQVLMLFGMGWRQRHFSFASEGALQTEWEQQECLTPVRR